MLKLKHLKARKKETEYNFYYFNHQNFDTNSSQPNLNFFTMAQLLSIQVPQHNNNDEYIWLIMK